VGDVGFASWAAMKKNLRPRLKSLSVDVMPALLTVPWLSPVYWQGPLANGTGVRKFFTKNVRCLILAK